MRGGGGLEGVLSLPLGALSSGVGVTRDRRNGGLRFCTVLNLVSALSHSALVVSVCLSKSFLCPQVSRSLSPTVTRPILSLKVCICYFYAI